MNNKEFKKKLIHKSFSFSKKIIGLVNNLPRSQSNKVVSDQLLRSSTSIGANIVEAQSASSKKDFTNFLSYSLKSGNECKYWLVLLEQTSNGVKEEVKELALELDELVKMLASSIITLRGVNK